MEVAKTKEQQKAEDIAEGIRAIYNLAAQIMDECATIMVVSGADESSAAAATTPQYWRDWGEN